MMSEVAVLTGVGLGIVALRSTEAAAYGPGDQVTGESARRRAGLLLRVGQAPAERGVGDCMRGDQRHGGGLIGGREDGSPSFLAGANGR